MAKAKFMNGEFSAKFKGKRKFVAEQMEAIKDYAARDDMQINICPVIQERPSEKKNTEEQIIPTHSIGGNLEHAVVAIYDNAGIPSFMHRFRKEDSEGLKADELREILLTVKGIGPAKAENIMEAVGKALAEKG